MAKIAKSIRVDPKVYEYIERYKGNGFNEKFEKIIIDAMESEKKRLDKIKQLEKQIEEKEKQLRKVIGEVNRMQDVSCKVTTLIRTCKEIEERLNINAS